MADAEAHRVPQVEDEKSTQEQGKNYWIQGGWSLNWSKQLNKTKKKIKQYLLETTDYKLTCKKYFFFKRSDTEAYTENSTTPLAVPLIP